ncbi:MAG: hypothetical protein UY90_C0094G0001, partial [Candidatus Peregrinibacteria bacterium GW2011_GWA2_54_9]
NRLPVLEDIVEIENKFRHAPSVEEAEEERMHFHSPNYLHSSRQQC